MYYLDKIYSLVQDCKDMVHFHLLVRCGFVATEFLIHLYMKIITEKEKSVFI